jgi:hypothetical protein
MSLYECIQFFAALRLVVASVARGVGETGVVPDMTTLLELDWAATPADYRKTG